MLKLIQVVPCLQCKGGEKDTCDVCCGTGTHVTVLATIDNEASVARVWRVFDNGEQKFISSGRGLFAKNGRSVWVTKQGALLAKKNVPLPVRKRLKVHEFLLIAKPLDDNDDDE